MSTAGIELAIWEMHRRGRGADFREDAAAYLDDVAERADISAEERALLLERDYPGLIDHGVHPMAVLFFSQVNQNPMPAYLAAIGADADRVEQIRAAFERAQRDR